MPEKARRKLDDWPAKSYPRRVETRLLAILLTDISGYTEFSSKADRSGVVRPGRCQND